jgi:hypothetical protein
VATYHGWGELLDLLHMGHHLGMHGYDHQTTYWHDNPELAMYDIQAMQERCADMGLTDGLRIMATPGGAWIWDPRWMGIVDHHRVTHWPSATTRGAGTVLDHPRGVVSCQTAADATTQLDLACVPEGATYGGSLVHLLLHTADVGGGDSTTAALSTLWDKVAALVAADRLQVITPHDQVAGLV